VLREVAHVEEDDVALAGHFIKIAEFFVQQVMLLLEA
jgi:hypothetical protein